MATIGNLSILTSVSTKGLATGLKKGEGMLKSFGKQVTSIKGLLVGFGAALAGSAVVSTLKSMTKEAMQSMDATAKLADSIGITTEALTSLRYGAGLAGASADDMDKSLIYMMKNLGANSKAFEAIGLDPEKLKSQDAVTSFGDIADAINKLPNAADRANAAMSIFGRNGAALLPTLAGGSDGIKAMADEAERLGITFNRVDAAKVELANDAMTRLSTVMTSLGQEIAIQVAPIIQGIAESFLNASSEGVKFGDTVSTSLKYVIKGAGILADVWHTVKLAFNGVQVLIQKGLALIVRGFAEAVKFMEKQVNKILAILPEWAKRKTGLTGPIDMSSGLDQFASSLEQSSKDASDAWMEQFIGKTPSERLDAWYEEVTAKSQKAAEAIAENAKKVNEIDMTPEIDTPKLPFSGQDISRWWSNAKKSLSEWWKGLGDLKDNELEKIEIQQPSLIMKGSQEEAKFLFDWKNLLTGEEDPQKTLVAETKTQTSVLQDILITMKNKVWDKISSFIKVPEAIQTPPKIEIEAPNWIEDLAIQAPHIEVPDWIDAIQAPQIELPNWAEDLAIKAPPKIEIEAPNWIEDLAIQATHIEVPDWIDAIQAPHIEVPDWIDAIQAPQIKFEVPNWTEDLASQMPQTDVEEPTPQITVNWDQLFKGMTDSQSNMANEVREQTDVLQDILEAIKNKVPQGSQDLVAQF